jgi:hypothetical protein
MLTCFSLYFRPSSGISTHEHVQEDTKEIKQPLLTFTVFIVLKYQKICNVRSVRPMLTFKNVRTKVFIVLGPCCAAVRGHIRTFLRLGVF